MSTSEISNIAYIVYDICNLAYSGLAKTSLIGKFYKLDEKLLLITQFLSIH